MKKKVILWIMQTQLYRWLLLKIVPFIRFKTYYTTLRGNKYHEAYKHLRPGDVVLGVDRSKLTTFLIPGELSHAGFCVGRMDGKNPGFEIAEMTHHGFTKSMFFDFCKEADRVVIMRCPNVDEDYIERMIARCLSFDKAKYDLMFAFGIEDLYCSEMVYDSDEERRFGASTEDLVGLDQEYISPMGLYHADNLFAAWDTDWQGS